MNEHKKENSFSFKRSVFFRLVYALGEKKYLFLWEAHNFEQLERSLNKFIFLKRVRSCRLSRALENFPLIKHRVFFKPTILF